MTLEKIMKHHTEGGKMIRRFNGKKEYILSEEDMNYIQGLVKKCSIPVVVKSFICDAEEKGGSRCETQCLGCDGFQRMDEAN